MSLSNLNCTNCWGVKRTQYCIWKVYIKDTHTSPQVSYTVITITIHYKPLPKFLAAYIIVDVKGGEPIPLITKN